MQQMGLILVMAVTIEALVEYAKTIVRAIQGKKPKAVACYLAAMTISILLCFAAKADLYSLVGVRFAWPWVGIVLTGVFASRGANFVSDFVKRLQNIGGGAADVAADLPAAAETAVDAAASALEDGADQAAKR